jgi:hypothetical protein
VGCRAVAARRAGDPRPARRSSPSRARPRRFRPRTPDARQAYRDALRVDDATWARGKGWVVTGIFGIPYYRDTNAVLVADKIRAIEAVLADSD